MEEEVVAGERYQPQMKEKIKSRERGRMDTVSGKKERKCWK